MKKKVAAIIAKIGNPPGVHVAINQEVFIEILQSAQEAGVQQLLAGAFIRRADAVLIIERVTDDFLGGFFELPSGHIEPGETLLDGLVREVQEETGLKILMVNSFAGAFDYHTGAGKLARQLNFEVEVADGSVMLNPTEHSSYRWCKCAEELSELKMSKETRGVLLQQMAKKI